MRFRDKHVEDCSFFYQKQRIHQQSYKLTVCYTNYAIYKFTFLVFRL